jgi:Family of unknown function (DUF6160)
MKTFQKITLAAAISAAPFASQALEALDDSVLAATTGQAGVTIEIDIAGSGISVGEIEYTDTAHEINDSTGKAPGDAGYVSTTADGGSVKLQNLVISNVNGLKQTIDIAEGGDLVIGMNALDGVQIALGGSAATSAVLLQSNAAGGALNQAEVVNNLNLTVDLGQTTNTIYNMSSKAQDAVEYVAAGDAITQTAFDTGRAETALGVAATQADVDNGVAAFAAVGSTAGTLGGVGVIGGYENTASALAIGVNASFEITDLDVGLFGYTATQAAAQVTGMKGVLSSGTATGAEKDGALALYNQAVVGAGGTAYADVAAYDAAVLAGGAGIATTDAQATGAVANGAAIKINDLKFYGTGGAGTKVTMDQVVWAKGGSSDLGGGVYIQIGQIAGTLDIGGIELGGSSIGQVKVSDINLAGMTQRIYGH